jgi:cytidine deaminase
MGQQEMTELVAAAREAAKHAYCPQSGFHVGAAVRTASGEIVPGCNVENSSYGLTNCAERTAMFAARALGHEHLTALALTCPDGDPARPSTLMPCGACRQVMNELLDDAAPIIVDQVGVFHKADLLPQAFQLE